MKALILAGGSGTRLWPLSRKNYPKQFLKLNGNQSLMHQTVERVLNVVSPDDVVVLTNDAYKFYVREAVNSLPGCRPNAGGPRVLLEPVGRNTAPAIALGAKYCIEELGCKGDDVVLVSPSDHMISPASRFADCVRLGENIAKEGHIVTFGIKPTRPETGYGYIKTGQRYPAADGYACFKAAQFTEKPDSVTATGYLATGNYFWNSGMFMFSIGGIIAEFEKHAPEIRRMIDLNLEDMLGAFQEMPDISIDYALMEKSDSVVMMHLDLSWNDIGSWDSLYDVLDKNDTGNVCFGDVLDLDTRNSFILGNKRLITTIGLEDCLVIETDDAVLIAKKGETQKVRRIVDTLREKGRKEALEHVTTYRPWGNYTILEEGPRYKIKRIVVNPAEKLSLQMHHHRSEHWVVIRGTAKVTIGDQEIMVHENESAYVPKSTTHRLENPGKVPAELIEVQNGEYLEEDDIVRFADQYGRQSRNAESRGNALQTDSGSSVGSAAGGQV